MIEIEDENEVKVIPEIRVLKADETEYWCDEIKAKVKRIFGVYVFDWRRHVHCCELTPSYECHFVEDQAEYVDGLSDGEIDKLDDLIREAQAHNDPVRYYHCSNIDSLPMMANKYSFPKGTHGVYVFTEEGDPEPKDSDVAVEEALEYGRCNEL